MKGEYDLSREGFLKSLGLKVVHIEDKLVKQRIKDVEGIVLEAIRIRAVELKTPPRL